MVSYRPKDQVLEGPVVVLKIKCRKVVTRRVTLPLPLSMACSTHIVWCQRDPAVVPGPPLTAGVSVWIAAPSSIVGLLGIRSHSLLTTATVWLEMKRQVHALHLQRLQRALIDSSLLHEHAEMTLWPFSSAVRLER
jgi:hypothetical protein